MGSQHECRKRHISKVYVMIEYERLLLWLAAVERVVCMSIELHSQPRPAAALAPDRQTCRQMRCPSVARKSNLIYGLQRNACRLVESSCAELKWSASSGPHIIPHTTGGPSPSCPQQQLHLQLVL